MVEARRRGESFDDFWYHAVRPDRAQRIVMVNDVNPPPGCVLWPTDQGDRREWRSAMIATREGWKRAYERLPQTVPEAAVAYLMDHLGEIDGLPLDDEPVAA